MSAVAVGTRILVVDDERLAREGLAQMLRAQPGVSVEACGSGEAAVDLLRREAFDIVFLDVQMRGLDGFGVIRTVGPERMPIVVFTTAYSEYALRAFEAAAVDYLLKPIGEERLAAALARAVEAARLRRLGHMSQQLMALLASAGESQRAPATQAHRFKVRAGRSVYFVEASQVDWIESADNYARLWVGTRSHLIRESMQSVEQVLAPAGFMRVHRGAIVNLARVREVRTTREGAYQAALAGGETVPVSRERRDDLLRALQEARGGRA